MLGQGKIALILMPLNALQDDQLESIRRLNNGGIPAKPCVVNGKTKTPALLEAIRRGEYTHIMTSPELALGAGSKNTATDSFRAVLCSQELQARVGFLAVDEAHIVEAWGHEFREAYGRIGELRSRPWVIRSLTGLVDDSPSRGTLHPVHRVGHQSSYPGSNGSDIELDVQSICGSNPQRTSGGSDRLPL